MHFVSMFRALDYDISKVSVFCIAEICVLPLIINLLEVFLLCFTVIYICVNGVNCPFYNIAIFRA